MVPNHSGIWANLLSIYQAAITSSPIPSLEIYLFAPWRKCPHKLRISRYRIWQQLSVSMTSGVKLYSLWNRVMKQVSRHYLCLFHNFSCLRTGSCVSTVPAKGACPAVYGSRMFGTDGVELSAWHGGRWSPGKGAHISSGPSGLFLANFARRYWRVCG